MENKSYQIHVDPTRKIIEWNRRNWSLLSNRPPLSQTSPGEPGLGYLTRVKYCPLLLNPRAGHPRLDSKAGHCGPGPPSDQFPTAFKTHVPNSQDLTCLTFPCQLPRPQTFSGRVLTNTTPPSSSTWAAKLSWHGTWAGGHGLLGPSLRVTIWWKRDRRLVRRFQSWGYGTRCGLGSRLGREVDAVWRAT